MGQLEAGLVHSGENGRRRRGRGMAEGHALGKETPLVLGRIEERRHDEGRAREMRHLVVGDGVVDRLRPHRAQAHMGAGEERDRPGKAPAVAVEHRQRPQIDRVLAHARGKRVGVTHQCRAAMMIDDALGVPGRAAGVVEGERVPFIVGHGPGEVGVALRDEIFVVERAEPRPLDPAFEVAVVDQKRLHLDLLQRLGEHGAELGVADKHLGVGVVEHEGDS